MQEWDAAEGSRPGAHRCREIGDRDKLTNVGTGGSDEDFHEQKEFLAGCCDGDGRRVEAWVGSR